MYDIYNIMNKKEIIEWLNNIVINEWLNNIIIDEISGIVDYKSEFMIDDSILEIEDLTDREKYYDLIDELEYDI
jgi:hypothetical protein